MDYVYYILLYGAVTLWIYILWSRRQFYKVAWQLPGPMGLPLIGLGLNMMNPESFLQFMNETARKYKSPFISWMGSKCFLYVNDPKTVEIIFNSPHCTNKGDFYRFMADAIGDGLFTSSSPRWNKHRRLINPAFTRQVIQNFLPIFNIESDDFLAKLAQVRHEKKGGVEIYALLKKTVLEAACQTTMGKKMNFQTDGSALIFEAYNGITEVCVKRMLSPWLYPDICYRYSALYTRQEQVVGVLFGFVENLLLRSGKSDSESTASDTNTFPTKTNDCDVDLDSEFTADVGASKKSKAIFVEQIRSHIEQGQLSWEDVRDEANVIIAATFETTSTALYLVCLCLAMHPECQDKLHAELLALLPGNKFTKICEDLLILDDVTHAHLDSLSYTEMVINEAMRLFAPVPMVLRNAANDFTLSNGVTVPRGTQIGIDIFNMQRSEDVWGKDALCFHPERHLQPPPHPFAYVPFTKGLRMCIGYRYALMLMKVMLAKIFLNYTLRTTARLEDLVIKGTISLKLRDYPLCELLPRQRNHCI